MDNISTNCVAACSHSNPSIPNIILNSALNLKSKLNICHINSRSITSKIDEFRRIFLKTNVHVIMISESWLSEDVTDSMVRIQGYKLFRNDRNTTTKGGGVAMYVKCGLSVKVLLRSDYPGEIEYIIGELRMNRAKVLLCCAYMPKKSLSNLSKLKSDLSRFVSQYENIVFGGDLNINLLNINDSLKSGLIRMCNALSLSICNSTYPTRFGVSSNGYTSSLLDVFITASKNQEQSPLFGQISVSGISDHDLIFISLNIQVKVPESDPITFRDYKNCNVHELLNEAAVFPWHSIFHCHETNLQLSQLNTEILKLFAKYVPLKTFKRRCQSVPYHTPDVEKAITDRDLAYELWKSSSSSSSRKIFVKLRNQVTLQIRKAKCSYYSSQFNTSLPTKQLWTNIKKLGFMDNSHDNDECSSIDCEQLNKHFIISTDPQVKLPDANIRADSNLASEFSFRNVSILEVANALQHIKSNAVGVDHISLRFIKLLLPVLLPYLTQFFNNILTTSKFPTAWKVAKVMPIPKKSKPGPLDFRPISILCSLSKVFEYVVQCQMTDYINANQLLCKFQSGFRPGHSTSTSLLTVTDDISLAMDKGQLSVLVLLDFSKAFDSVNHILLLNKLRTKFGFTNCAINLLKNYLLYRTQFVTYGDSSSSISIVPNGVPQGSILGPLLFSLYLNDLSTFIKDTNFHFYADDAQLYISGLPSKMDEIISVLNNQLKVVYSWAELNLLSLNAKKSQAIIISRDGKYTQISAAIMLGNEEIKLMNSVKNLGVIFNSYLTWDNHIDTIASKVYSTLRKLWRVSGSISVHTKCFLIKTLVLPFFTYCDVVYSSMSQKCLSRINVLFNDCARYVYNRRRFVGISDVSSSILGCSITSYLNNRYICFLHKLLAFQKPLYLADRIQFARSSRSCALIVPRHNQRMRHLSYFVKVVTLWNSLPLSLKRLNSHSKFRKVCIEYFRGNFLNF